jgi:WD40 repeat protein
VNQAIGDSQAENPFAFSLDGKVLAKRQPGYGNAFILLWDVATGKLLNQPLAAHFYPIDEIAVSADGSLLASRNLHEDFVVWDVAMGKALYRKRTAAPVAGLAFSMDGKGLFSASSDGTVQQWEPASGKELRRFPAGPVESLASLTMVLQGLAAGYRDGRLVLLNPATGERSKQFQVQPIRIDQDGERYTAPVSPLVFAPNGKTMAFGNGHYELSLANAQTGKVLHRLPTRSRIQSLAFSPDGKTLASTGPAGDKVIRLWETATGKERLRIGDDRNAYFHSVAFTADGKTLVSGGADATIRFWDVASAKEIGRLPGHHGAVTALAFLPDGRLVSGSADTTILIWDKVRCRNGEAAPPARPSEKELETLWTNLAGGDAPKAFQTIHTLAAAPTAAVPFLSERLVPVPRADAKRLDRLIKDLDDAQFTVRQKAAVELEALEEQAEPALRQIVAGKPALELRNRVEQLLDKLSARIMPADELRVYRSIEVLEQSGTREAQQVLARLATGAAGARITEDAQAAMKRLAERR